MSVTADQKAMEGARERAAAEADSKTNGNGRSIAERAGDEPDQDELFPHGSVEGDAKVTVKNLIKAGLRIEYTASLSRAEVPLKGGLLDPDKPGQILVSYEAAKAEIIHVRKTQPDGSKKITGAKVRQHVRSTYVEPAERLYTRVQVIDIATQLGVPESSNRLQELLGPE